MAAQREEAERGRVPDAGEQLGAGDDRAEGAPLVARALGGVDGVGERESDGGGLGEALERQRGRRAVGLVVVVVVVGRRRRVVAAPACFR